MSFPKEIESNLAISQLKVLANTLDGIMILLSSKGIILTAWTEAETHPFFDLANCNGQIISEYLNDNIWRHFEHKFQGILKDQEQRIFEFSYKQAQETFWYQVILNHIPETDHPLARVSILIRNITQIHANRIALRQGQASLHALVSSLDDLVFLLDTSGVFLSYWTRDPQNLFMPPEEFLEKPLEQVFTAETARMFRNAITWVLHSRKPQTVDYPSTDGNTWLEATINAVEPPDMPVRISILVKNITRRKQAEIALLRFQEGLTTLNQISFSQNMEIQEQIQEGLKLMLEYFHMSVGVISKIEEDQFTPLSLVSNELELNIKQGITIPLEETFCKHVWQRNYLVAERDLNKTEWGLNPSPLKEADLRCFMGCIIQVENQPYGTVSFFDKHPYPRDFETYDFEFTRIFARWISFVLEQDLQKNRLISINQNKERIMDIIAHDLRNPMGAVLGLAEYSLHMPDANLSEPLKEVLQGIINGTNRALQLLESLLKVERMDSGHQAMNKIPYAPTDLIKEVIERCSEKAQALKIELKTDFESRAFTMLDPLWMNQAIENLFNNALKFTPTGGSITSRITTDDYHIHIIIEDTGIGIPESLLPHIFDKFTKSKRLGLQGEATTGLGLYLVRQIIEQHQGKIECESHEKQGSKFIIKLPKMVIEAESEKSS